MKKMFTRSCKSNKTITTGKQGTGMSSNLRHFLWKRRKSPIVWKIIKITSRKSEIARASHHARSSTELVLALRQELLGYKHTDSTAP